MKAKLFATVLIMLVNTTFAATGGVIPTLSAKDLSMNSFSPDLKYFVAMYHGTYPTEAVAISGARLPNGATQVIDFNASPGPSRILVFRAPPGTTDDIDGFVVLILQPAQGTSVHLWLSGTDLARTKREDAEADITNFKEVGGGSFRLFERE